MQYLQKFPIRRNIYGLLALLSCLFVVVPVHGQPGAARAPAPAPAPAPAIEPEACKNVRFAANSWTDTQATTGTALAVLKALDYQPKMQLISIPKTLEALKKKEIDVFLGNWMPAMEKLINPYLAENSIEIVAQNLADAKYTLAVPSYLYKKGLKNFQDIVKFKKKLDSTIYASEPGSAGNLHITNMINSNDFGLKGWRIVESNELGMLDQVAQAIARKKPIVFLAWEPHPMNMQFKINYLAGGDKYFGADYGGSSVFTNVRTGFTKLCPNIGQFLINLRFSLQQENEVMSIIMNHNADPQAAGKAWLVRNPDKLTPMLEGVKTRDGKDGLMAVKAAFGIN